LVYGCGRHLREISKWTERLREKMVSEKVRKNPQYAVKNKYAVHDFITPNSKQGKKIETVLSQGREKAPQLG